MSQPPPDTLDALPLLPRLKRKSDAHKGDAGKVLLIGGAETMSGALVLAGQAALYSGAGWVVLMMLDAKSAHLVPGQPELMVHDANSLQPRQALQQIQPDVIGIGPGMGQSADAIEWLAATLSWPVPLVIDADAINVLSANPELLKSLQARLFATTMTPHPGEAGRMLGCSSAQVQADRIKSIKALVELTQAVVVLKGHHTLIGSPKHNAVQCLQGNPALAVGGTGDVLTGCIAALAAQGIKHSLDQWQATCLAVQLHAMAADSLVSKGIGPIGLTPSELVHEVRECIHKNI
jgi:hydroxyethylthiazole kinase-like uncharacterized protein yjeF